MRHLLILVLAMGLGATERTVTVGGPLTATVASVQTLSGLPAVLQAVVVVPDDAPSDLGVGAWVADRHGLWFQVVRPGRLAPGRQALEFRLDGEARLQPEGHGGAWDALLAAQAWQTGLLFFTATAQSCRLVVERLEPKALPPPPTATTFRLHDLETAGGAAVTGERWRLRFRPQPAPAEAFDDQRFAATVEFTDPEGVVERVAAFYRQPMDLLDRGDREVARPSRASQWEVRWRPRRPGRWAVRLRASWDGVERVVCDLPPITVSGPLWDDYVRVDAGDPRFLSRGGGRFAWPVGLNVRSPSDPRANEFIGSRPTPDRGTAAYAAYLQRLACAGGDTVEVWMSSWNLALEWRADWPGFHGVGRFNQGNAERLDRLLDLAWAQGVRVNLVVRNHGQASEKTDREWHDNPWSRSLRADPARPFARLPPGPLASAGAFFEDPAALAGQDRLHRYLVARWADHPAILAWKLWTEINLTAGGPTRLRNWHERTTRIFRAVDPYRHPLTTHWSGNYLQPDRAMVAGQGDGALDLVCIDAYHGRDQGGGVMLAQVIWEGLLNEGSGLGRYGKPILVTEFGGNWNACPPEQLAAEHASGPWAALITGNAGAPMLWWFEWVDQHERYRPYGAVAGFLAGEDLRSRDGSPARSVTLPVSGCPRPVWANAWARPGRLLGYLLDQAWGFDGREAGRLEGALVVVGESVAAGTVAVEWWDADTGRIIGRRTWLHPGGRLVLEAPAFARHLAFKLSRDG